MSRRTAVARTSSSRREVYAPGEPLKHGGRGVDRQREAEALVAAGLGGDLLVDADHMAA